jgi:hypothetical protein
LVWNPTFLQKVSKEIMAFEDLSRPLTFCVLCFATDEGGSWGGSVESSGTATHCFNCGAGGTGFSLPRQAVDEIRKNASWVGKRYYPSSEDFDNREEVQALRALPTKHWGRSATRSAFADDKDKWTVTQLLKGNPLHRTVSVFVAAETAEEALEKAKLLLPYVPSPT